MTELYRNLVAGEWLEGTDVVENRNPSDVTGIVGMYAQVGSDQMEDAVAAARVALPAWRSADLKARQTILETVGRELMARADELGVLLSREEGKPVAEGRGEVYRAGQFFTYFAAEVLRQLSENADSVRPGIEIDIRRESMGVIAVISPWNFPTATASWTIAPALAYGNCVIWKPPTKRRPQLGRWPRSCIVPACPLASNLKWIDRARATGAVVATGDERLQLAHDGYYMAPALLTETTNDIPLNREEMFAPIAAIQRIGSYEEG